MRAFSLVWLCVAIAGQAAETGSIIGKVHRAGSNQPVSRAIVYLGAGNGRVATNVAPVVLEVRDGMLQPQVQLARRGATLVLRNTDPMLHILRVEMLSGTNAPALVLTQAMPYAGFQKGFALDGFRDTMLLRVTGGNGEEMSAYIAVLPHPWGVLTDANGRFAMTGIPAGNYKLYVWHEMLGTLARDVKVMTSRPTQMDLEFSTP